jgi:hypothetical protein
MKESTRILIAQFHRFNSTKPRGRMKNQKAENLQSMRRQIGSREASQLFIRWGKLSATFKKLGCDLPD